jgi:predicted TPR repeat methyltransferase
MTQETNHHQLYLLTLLVLVLIAYIPLQQVPQNDFVNYDDYRYVLDNRKVRDGLTFDGVLWAFSNLDAGFWHPLTWLSHMLDCELYGIRPQGHHLSSLLLHLANVLLLFLFLERATGSPWRSALLAALFAVHPLHVESVAWVSQRKDLLSTLFWNLALLAYVGYAETPSKTGYALTLLFFCLGLLSKPMVVTLPLVLLLLDLWPLRRLQRMKPLTLKPFLVEKVPFFVLSVVFALITYFAEKNLGALPGLGSYPVYVRLCNAVVSYATYPLKMILPTDLSVIYLHPGSFAFWKVAGGTLFLLSVSVLVLHQSRARPYLTLGWFWYLTTLLPVIGLVQIGSHAYADRYTYVPLTGLFMMMVWGIPPISSLRKSAQIFLTLLIAAAMFGLGWTTRNQVAYWKDSVTLFRRAVQSDPGNFVAHNNLGFTLAQRGRFEEAADHYEKAIRLNPNYPDALFHLANTLEILGRKEEAILYYRRVLDLNPSLANPHRRLGMLLLQEGNREEALIHLNAAARLNPSDGEILQQAERLQKDLSQP